MNLYLKTKYQLVEVKRMTIAFFKSIFQFLEKKIEFCNFLLLFWMTFSEKGHFKSRSKFFFFWLTQKSERNRERYALFVVELTRWKYRNIEIKKSLCWAREKSSFSILFISWKRKSIILPLYTVIPPYTYLLFFVLI
jgi:hypothetical protein